jgi:hypothetical protein
MAAEARRSYSGSVEDDPARAAGDRDRREANSAAEDRDRIAEDRDRRAEAHDRVSEARDSRADERDERAEARERVAGGDESGRLLTVVAPSETVREGPVTAPKRQTIARRHRQTAAFPRKSGWRSRSMS